MPGEKISTYIAELKKMAEYCKFGSTIDEAIRDRLIAGIEDDSIRRKLLGEGDSLTLHKAIEIALALEAAAQDAKDLQSQRKPEVVKKIKQGNWRLKPSTTGKMTKSENYTCIRCGSKDHKQDKCPHLKAKCFNCGKIGHLGRSCLKRKPQRNSTANKDGNKVHAIAETEISSQIFKIINLWRTTDPIKIEVQINDKILSLEYDTGSAYSLISDSTRRFFKLPNPCPADPLRVKLATYSGQPLQVLGTLDVPVQYQNSTQTLPLMVVGGEGPSLCGRNWMEALGILPTQPYKVDMIKVTENNLPTQLHRFRELFSPGYGVFKGVRARLLVDPEMKPRFFKSRPIPYALKEKISRELDRLVKAGILKPVRHAEWAAPIVPVLKSDQTIRICGDFKITANQSLKVDQYPLHKAEDIFPALAGGEKFSKIDLRDAYNQLELDDESQLYIVINTHQGLYKYTRLPFGISSAPALFQKQMDILLKGIPMVFCALDDILITGKNDQDHLKNLECALQRIQEAGLKLRKDKCSFLAPSLDTIIQLTKKGTEVEMGNPRRKSIQGHKEKLVHSTLLVHFYPRKRQILSCDASGVGIGAVISQVQGDNDIRPVAFASRTLTPAEKRYSQLEREALGIVFGVTRFRNYLLGNSFTLRTDHKPMVTLFSENKGIPTIAANRIQRWAIILSAYQYKIEYIKGTSNTEADVLSRLPMFTPEPDSKEPDSEPVEMVLLMDALDSSPVTSDDIRTSLPGDPALRQALDHTLQGACEGLLFWGNRVIIPTNLRAKMLDELHNSHQGIVGLKSVARTLFWWPGLDKDIEGTVRRCNCCQSHASMPPRTTPVNWPPTNQHWDRVQIDHLGPFEQNLYLIVVDACTKWIEAIPVPNTSTRETIEQLRCLFARFGIPRTLVSDNGTGFTSEEFRQFMTRNGICHLRTAPFHPSSNGLAERAVQTIKTGLKKVQQGSISQRLAEILLGYRRTPIASIGKSPSEMMFGHNIRSRLDLILPNPGKSEEPGFKVGESVWYRTYKSGPKWDQASIQGPTGNRLVTLQTAKGQCADAFRMLTVAYGEATLDRSNVYRWYKMFSEGREDVNDEEPAGRPSTSATDEKINEVEKMILANRRITVREVAEDLNISIGSCHSIFINDLGMRRVAAKFVPKLLNCHQKQHRMNIANEMLDSVRNDPNLLQRVITDDESWVYGYDVETKAQSSQWKLPHEPQDRKKRAKFGRIARMPGENISTYIAELKKMAEYCKFGSTIDEAIRDRLIAGIEDDSIQRKLLGEGDSLTLHKAIEIALALEAAAQDAKDLQSQRKPEVVKKIKQGNWRLKPSTTGKITKSENYTCIRCGSKDHKQDKCPHLKAKCFNCCKIGHLGRSCLKRKPQRNSTANKDGNKVHAIAETEISSQIFKIINLWRTTDPIKIEVQINDKILSLEYDTGSAYSLISDSTRRFFKLPNPCPADPLRVKLATYSGQPLQVLGTLDVPVQYQNSTQTLPLMVVGGEGPSLCGRNWMEALGILPTQPYKVDMIKVTENNLPTQLHRFRELFSPGYGVFKGVRARLLVDPEMKPRFFKSRPIPYALKEKISRELDRLVKAGILKPVRHAEWAAPIVPVLKSDQTIRICGDFKITANQSLKVDQYPLHKAEDIFPALAGGEKFSKIDLRDAYNQLELDDESQLYIVINTHQGLYKYTRLPFGISSAPALFQIQMDILLKGIPKVFCALDDILITGKNDQDHLKNLECVLQRIQEAGLKLRKDKCSFLAPSLEYLGHKIAKEGLQPLPSKVEAIQAAPSPTNLTELRAFLGNSFTLRTDHKPMVTLFSENKGIPTIAANRIQRWAIILSAYQYKIEYIKGTSNTEADVLSRLPMFTPEPDSKEPDSEPVEMVLLMDALDSSPVTSDDIRTSLPGDPALRQALDHTLQGWSEETPKEMELMPYWSRRYELGACEGLLFWGNRVIIPTNLRAKMLDELHNSHQGIVGLKSVARTLFWWPGLDKDIEGTVRRCNCCQSHASMPPRTTPVNWPPTNQPWDRVQIDHLGPFEQNLYLIVVDACTKWIEAIPVPNTSTRETIEQLRCLFARFGIPRTLVSDNGTGFTFEEFRQFMTRNGICHLRTAPFHPSSNGLAERAVQTIKTGLKKVQQGSISQRLAEILLGYRRTPIASIGKSPSEMMFGHNIRSRLDLILPNPGKSEEPGFKVGESVWYRTYKSGPKWDQASIQGPTGNRLVTLQTAKGQ
ncbi:K02A2.6-like, partial [Cordylochernes scorpioides]